MEFNTRGFQPTSGRQGSTGTRSDDIFGPEPEPTRKEKKPKKPRRKLNLSGLFKKPATVVVISAIVLILVVALSIKLFSKGESALVDSTKYQVVALSDDRAFFGKLTKFTDDYIVLEDAFYLENTSSENTGTAQLIKRGCEAWRPTNRMVIYRSDVLFWENMDGEGQVAKLIAQWKEQNPDGQKCNTSNTTTMQQQTTTPTTTTPSTTTQDTPTTTDTTESTETDSTTTNQ